MSLLTSELIQIKSALGGRCEKISEADLHHVFGFYPLIELLGRHVARSAIADSLSVGLAGAAFLAILAGFVVPHVRI